MQNFQIFCLVEHIDYEGYSVLPMAIRQDTIVAIRKRDAGESEKFLRIANVNEKYTMCTYPVDPDQVNASSMLQKQIFCCNLRPLLYLLQVN